MRTCFASRRVNDRGDVVDFSNPPGDADGRFIARGFADSLVSAQDITDDGRITGALVEKSTGRALTYVAVPARP